MIIADKRGVKQSSNPAIQFRQCNTHWWFQNRAKLVLIFHPSNPIFSHNMFYIYGIRGICILKATSTVIPSISTDSIRINFNPILLIVIPIILIYTWVLLDRTRESLLLGNLLGTKATILVKTESNVRRMHLPFPAVGIWLIYLYYCTAPTLHR